MLMHDALNFYQKAFIIIFIFLLIYICLKIYSIRYENILNEHLKNKMYLLYIDNFYICNKYYTFFSVFCYFFFIIFIFFLWRYSFIGNIIEIHKQILNTSLITYTTLFQLFFNFILIIIILLLYISIIKLLFYKEVLKLFIYIQKYNWYQKFFILICDMCEFFDYLVMLMETILNLIPERDYNKDYAKYNIFLYEDCIRTRHLTTFIINLCKKYSLIHKLFFTINYLIAMLARGIFFMLQYFFYSIFILIFIYELCLNKFHNIYLASLCFFIIINIINVILFIRETISPNKLALYDYFYKNMTKYDVIRIFLIKEKTFEISPQTKRILSMLQHNLNLIDYLKNNLREINKITLSLKERDKKISKIYIRYQIVFLSVCFCFYIYLNENKYVFYNEHLNMILSIKILFIPTLLLLYFSWNSYYIENNSYDGYNVYEFTKKTEKYVIAFWIALILIQIPLIWYLLLKCNLFWTLEDLFSFKGFHIIYMYSIEEKICYIQRCLEIYYDNTILRNQNMFEKYILIKNFITENTTLKDIQTIVEQYLGKNLGVNEKLENNSFNIQRSMIYVILALAILSYKSYTYVCKYIG